MKITQDVRTKYNLTKGQKVILKDVLEDYLLIRIPGINEDIILAKTTQIISLPLDQCLRVQIRQFPVESNNFLGLSEIISCEFQNIFIYDYASQFSKEQLAFIYSRVSKYANIFYLKEREEE